MNQPLADYRVGGLVVRKMRGRAREGPTQTGKYMLVTSYSNPTKWIIPAGHVEAGETDEEAAVREVLEEAGVAAVVRAELDRYQHRWMRGGREVVIETRIFLMDYCQTVCVNAENRRVGFFSYEEVLKLNLWEETREFFQKAHGKMREILKRVENE